MSKTEDGIESFLLVDIGGGSTEIIFKKGNKLNNGELM